MTESVLIFKKKGRKTEIKVTKKMRGSYTPSDCTRIVNMNNYKDLCLFLHDLEYLFGAQMEKAVRQFLEDKDNNWPF